MQYRLYEYELEERLDDLQSSLTADQDDYIFTRHSRFIQNLLYDLCRKALSEHMACPRRRVAHHLSSENRSDA